MHDEFEHDPLLQAVAALPTHDVDTVYSDRIRTTCRELLQKNRTLPLSPSTLRRIRWASIGEAAIATVLAAGYLLGVFERAWLILSA